MSYIHTANLVLIVVATVIGGVLYSPVPASVGVAFAVAIDIFSSRFARALATREYSKATGMEPGVIDVNRTFGHE